MKIEAISHSLPSWKVSNDEVIDLIKFNSKGKFEGNLQKTLRMTKFILERTGAENRFWLDSKINEKPIDHIIKTAEEALKNANMQKNDVDLLIYVGIGKGFLEPGNSYLVAQALGMKNTRCLDITDACMSWLSTMQIVDSLFKTKSYKNALIINAEFTVQGGVLFDNFALKNEAQLEYTFPTFTIGEGAAATIVSPENEDNFKFDFISKPDLADLCVIPLPEYKKYCIPTEKTSKNGIMKFTSFGFDLHNAAEQEAVKLVNNSKIIDKNKVDIVFTHASSKTEWQKYANKADIGDKIYHIYHKTGNLVSASIPAAISIAKQNNKLKKGDKILSWVGSAGMSFGFGYFNL
jgi:3-oxoacyl-[acyl-carrier-protein] synthase III